MAEVENRVKQDSQNKAMVEFIVLGFYFFVGSRDNDLVPIASF